MNSLAHKNTPKKVIIIGAGIGGLSCGIILKKLGFSVTILEKNSRPGGLSCSHNRNKMECEVGIHYLGSLDKGQILQRFFSYLGVEDNIPVKRMGDNGVIDRYLFNSKSKSKSKSKKKWHFDLPSGMEAFKENLKQSFPKEQKNIAAITALIEQAAQQLHGLDFLYNDQNDFSLLDQAQSFGDILDNMQVSPQLRSVLAIASS